MSLESLIVTIRTWTIGKEKLFSWGLWRDPEKIKFSQLRNIWQHWQSLRKIHSKSCGSYWYLVSWYPSKNKRVKITSQDWSDA